ncbi:DoxX family protein [Inhella proteolytica]|uniref:DoxX family protein n=1 Tax=Inhella proteolytica TaxID=2795029 RepID=A0A931NH89_9BURK|nr:DoxX family protein [Inhella proteolytica]MBH9576260.1 DoxX family protein [Inhella proteolytica]
MAAPALIRRALHGLEWLQGLEAPLLLLARLHVAWVFFASGLTKLRNWETTLTLFTDDYHVPLLPPEAAAWAGTAGELLLPPLLVLGLLDRVPALGLLVVNAVAVLSLPDIAPAAWAQHQLWGVLLVVVAVRGPGAWALPSFWRRIAASAPR